MTETAAVKVARNLHAFPGNHGNDGSDRGNDAYGSTVYETVRWHTQVVKGKETKREKGARATALAKL